MATAVVQRTVQEVIQRHLLHGDVKEVFVEGLEDKHFYDYFLRTIGAEGVVVYPIDTVNVPTVEVFSLQLPDGCRGRVVTLASMMEDRVDLRQAVCIADLDTDAFAGAPLQFSLLVYTDGTALETYAFSEPVLDKYLNLGLRNFPKTVTVVISELRNILQEAFLLRVAATQLSLPGKFPNAEKEGRASFSDFCEFDRRHSTARFRRDAYIQSCFETACSREKVDELRVRVEELRPLLPQDPARATNGHDFREALAWYIRQHDGFRTLNAQTIAHTLFAVIELQHLEKQRLFQELIARLC